MRIKYNIPMLNEIKNKIESIKLKVKTRNEKKEKIPIRYYTLLVLMLAVGLITMAANIRQYNNLHTENYTKYTLEDSINVESDKIKNEVYETAISSISTNISNMEDSKDTYSTTKFNTNYIWPVIGEVIKEQAIDTLSYSKTLDMWRVHPGIDIAAEWGSEVKAVKNGSIIEIAEDIFYGNTVKIKHDDGYISVYSNLDISSNIREGEKINQGEIIGKVGTSGYGESADESHLHFEILKNNEWINPIEILE